MSTWSLLFVVLLPGNHSVSLTLAGCKSQCINAENINANSLTFKRYLEASMNMEKLDKILKQIVKQ